MIQLQRSYNKWNEELFNMMEDDKYIMRYVQKVGLLNARDPLPRALQVEKRLMKVTKVYA